MTEKYTGQAMDKRYRGEAVDVTFNLGRCIHSAVCLQRLGQVFDTGKRPWIMADNASADEVAAAVAQCPSGALHFERKDGGAEEPLPGENVILARPNGPLQLLGNLSIQGETVAIEQETRATLCRCGASQNKPFCDNSHRQVGFQARGGVEQPQQLQAVATDGQLKITPLANGPLLLEGGYEIRDARGEVLARGNKTALCRCGHSANKPFCDGTHRRVEFAAE
ncbi:MAG: CDGSH iron-sulfur domain-containing protein [Anaerolineae bacterium]